MIARLEAVDWDIPAYKARSGTQGIHGLHWYPAPFPAALPATMIDILADTAGVFLDPFCGSGVSLVEAWIRGHRAFGIDINRFAVALVEAKIGLLSTATASRGAELASAYTDYVARARPRLVGTSAKELCADGGMQPEAADWFGQDELADVLATLEWTRSLGPTDADWSWMLLSSLLHRSSVLRDVHYTYIVDRSRVTRPATSDVDLPARFAAKLRLTFRDAGRSREELIAAGVDLQANPRPVALAGRAEDAGLLVREPVDLVVTSPPYFGMNDYVRSQYLSWLIQPWEGYEDDRCAEAGQRRGRRNVADLETYIESMRAAFDQVVEIVRPGGHVAVVIGASKSALSRERDPVSSVRLAMDRTRLHLIWTGSRRVRNRKINNSPGCAEEVWVFRK